MAVPGRQRQQQAAVNAATATAGTGVLLGRALSPPMYATVMSKAAGGGGKRQHVIDNAAKATAAATSIAPVLRPILLGDPGRPAMMGS